MYRRRKFLRTQTSTTSAVTVSVNSHILISQPMRGTAAFSPPDQVSVVLTDSMIHILASSLAASEGESSWKHRYGISRDSSASRRPSVPQSTCSMCSRARRLTETERSGQKWTQIGITSCVVLFLLFPNRGALVPVACLGDEKYGMGSPQCLVMKPTCGRTRQR